MKNKDTVAIKGHTQVYFIRSSKKELKQVRISNKWFHGILDCKLCNILWDRNVNVSKNMLDISFSVWNGEGRPQIFLRESP
jgi:hypothetical protein